MRNEWRTLSFYKNICLYFSRKRPKLLWYERQTETNREGCRRRQTAILTHNFLTALWDAAPAGYLATYWRSPWLTESLLAASWNWLMTARISREHMHISFHNAHTFLFTHVTASAYLHRCFLWLTARSRVNMQQLDCEITTSPDTLRVLLARFAY